MRRLIGLSAVFLAAAALLAVLLQASGAAADTAWKSKVDPWILAEAESGASTEFLLMLNEQADLSFANTLPTKLEKGTFVYRQLQDVARRTQSSLLAEFEAAGIKHRSFWVANMIWVRGDQALVEKLAQRDEVSHLYANPAVRASQPIPGDVSQRTLAPSSIEWNVSKIGAPALWDGGYTGQGVVIGGQDTGYDWDHPALQNAYRGWNGTEADHNYSWHDAIHETGSSCGADSPVPCDDNSHGTHTMGSMIGDDGGSNQIGVAPGARWIGCRNMNAGWGKPSTYAECYQWFIAPTDLSNENADPAMAPDVINNSWACPPVEGCTDPTVLLAVVDSVRAAGIVTVHSAGNSGPSCSTVRDPAAIYDASFTVAATDIGDNIASFSSRGPVTIDGSNRLKPDISAPGVSVRSALPGTGYGYKSGTSMAGPHVAGLVALLISAQPELAGNVDAIEAVIERSAVPLTSTQGCGGDGATDVPNHVFGHGRIDAPIALSMLDHSLQVIKAGPASVLPGAMATYDITVTHYHSVSGTTGVILSDSIPLGSSFVTATMPFTLEGSLLGWHFPSLSAQDSRNVSFTVSVPLTASGFITSPPASVSSDQVEVTFSSGQIDTAIGALYRYFYPVFIKD